MRCPKCHYLSFDPEPRCKNCGYDLEVDDADLALRTAERADVPLPDLKLHSRPDRPERTHRPDRPQRPHRPQTQREEAPVTLELVSAAPKRASRSRVQSGVVLETDPYVDPVVDDDLRIVDVNDDVQDLVQDLGQDDVPVDVSYPTDPEPELEEEAALPPAVADESPRVPFRAPHTTTDLPLFVKGMSDRNDFPDENVMSGQFIVTNVPVAPRPPLGVRRTAPEPVRSRQKLIERRLGPLDHDLLEDLKRVEREEAMFARAEALPTEDEDDRVEPAQRAGAAAIDAALLGSIAGFVFWATLRLCNVSAWDLGLQAWLPLMLFLVLMDAGYLLLFTAAGGQTVGKMWMGLRVVSDPADAGHHIPLGQAAFRAAMTLVSVAGLGLGWVPAFFGRGLTLHDRVTHTRVVRV